MPNFKYADDETRIYDQWGTVEKGRVVEADSQPDYRWEPTQDAVTDPPAAPLFLPEELRKVGPTVEQQIALQELADPPKDAPAEQVKAVPPTPKPAPTPPADLPPATPTA